MIGVRGILIDLDGVLYVSGVPLVGAAAALARLRATGLPLGFITNTTRQPRRAIRARMEAMGMPIGEAELFTPARAACDWLRSRALAPHLLIHPDLAEDFAELGRGVGAVVVGDAGPHFAYDMLNEAFRLVMAGAPLLALATNRYFREADGLSLDAGPFVAALEYAAGVEARVFGKPASMFFQAAVAGLGLRPAEVAMIGDDVEADVNGAIAAGLFGILVKTGKYRLGDEARMSAGGALATTLLDAAGMLLPSPKKIAQ